MYFKKVTEDLGNDQDTNLAASLANRDQVDRTGANAPPHLLPTSPSPVFFTKTPLPLNPLHQLPRDRANSLDGHILRSLMTRDMDDSPREIASTASSSPLHPMTDSSALSRSSSNGLSPANPPAPSVQQNPPSRNNGLLYNLLISSDSKIPPVRLKQPFASTNTTSISEAKKHRFEEPEQSRSMLEFTGLRRFSFGGYSASRGDRIPATLRGRSGPATVPMSFRPKIGRAIDECVAVNAVRASTFPNSSTSAHSILSALISSPCLDLSPGLSSTSTDSGLDEPLDLTGCSVRTRKTTTAQTIEAVQLAKKTARPVHARVSEWLRQAAEFAQSNKLLPVSWTLAFRSVWHRLLILSMAEHALDVVLVESPHAAEHLSVGEPILPWLALSSDVQQLVPTRKFANQVVHCLNGIREQNLSSEEFAMLRKAVLLTADQPEALPTFAVNTIRIARSATSGDADCCSSDQDDGGLSPLSRALLLLTEISPSKFAGLFCCHLKGESSLVNILPPELRSSSQPRPDAEQSILGSLIYDAPQPTSTETQTTAGQRIFTTPSVYTNPSF
uniref:Folliculin-interacting protein 1 n=1 Tax=Mesocestoides corti TaxID=53468 RepID=A0A5K3EHK6_MESCO